MDEKVWRDVSIGKIDEPMLCPDLVRQRCVIEFFTNLEMNDFSFMENYLTLFLKELSVGLEMKIFIGPIIGNDKNIETKESGPSAFVGWTTSGCQIHSWPFRKFVSVDIYSCKIFSIEKVINIIERYFGPTKGIIIRV
jgi:S-adenosylmethionine/arginine decarboxylase-like enzyme